MILHQKDSRNYVEKIPHATDPAEDNYRFIFDGDFQGSLRNRQVVSIERDTGKSNVERVEEQIIKMFDDMYAVRQAARTKPPATLTADEFCSFLRDLQKSPYRWPNRYFAWRKPNQSLLMVGISSTQMYHLLKYEICQTPGQVQFGIPGDYAARLYDINPKVTHMMSGNIKYDPVDRLVSEIRSCEYLGSWDDPDILMETPHGFNRQLACGRWDLAKEHILGGREGEKSSLSDRISDASERAGSQVSANAPSRGKEH